MLVERRSFVASFKAEHSGDNYGYRNTPAVQSPTNGPYQHLLLTSSRIINGKLFQIALQEDINHD